MKIRCETYFGHPRVYEVHPWDIENNPLLMLWVKAWTSRPSPSRAIVDRILTQTRSRDEAIHKYGFGVPDHAALMRIKNASPNGVIEIGAGTGYWAKLLQKLGVAVEAYDNYTGKYRHGFVHGSQTIVHRRTHRQALSSMAHRDKTLLLVWPDYDVEWPAEALELYKGDTVAYVGEGDGGCTGNDRFHTLIHDGWEGDVHDLPQWWGVHDDLYILKRKAKHDGKAKKHTR